MSRKKINKIGIYKITNIINNKIYIGQSKEIRKRWIRHIRELNNKKHGNRYLQRSWDKYGEENFKFEIIEECSEEQLDERERYWISFYKSNNFKKGYNCDDGGSKGKTVNKDVAIKRAKKRTYAKGEDTINALLTNKQVVQIKKLLYEGRMTQKEIANEFGVGNHIISTIKSGKSYKNVITPYDESIKPIKNNNKNMKILTEKEVLEIKKLLATTDMNQVEIASAYNINRKAIVNIKNMQSWALIGKEYNEIIKNKDCKHGEGNVHSKFTREDVIKVKKLLATTTLESKQIAEKCNMSLGLVQDIKHFRAWKHIETEYDDKIKELNDTDNKLLYNNITEEDIIEIKKLIVETDISLKEIAKKFNVTENFIQDIKQLNYFPQIGIQYNGKLNIREENFLNEITLIKKELATTNKTKIQISQEFEGRSRKLVADIAKLKSYTNIAPEYNSILKEKYSGSQREVLNEEQVKEIKKMLVKQNLKDKEIAEIYDVKHTTIQSIRLLRTWVNIAPEYNELIKQKQIKSKQSA